MLKSMKSKKSRKMRWGWCQLLRQRGFAVCLHQYLVTTTSILNKIENCFKTRVFVVFEDNEDSHESNILNFFCTLSCFCFLVFHLF